LSLWKEKKIAILLIHGIGEQKAYQTLDGFTQTFLKTIKKMDPENAPDTTHKLTACNEFTRSYIRVADVKTMSTGYVDIHEYYWAHFPQRTVNYEDIIKWLKDTSRGAIKFYHQNAELVKKYEKRGSRAFKKGAFKKHGYLHLLSSFRILVIFLGILLNIREVQFLLKNSVILNWLFKKINKMMIDYVGDIVAYTGTDKKSEHHKIRQTIIKGASEYILSLLKSSDYDRIIIVGHSLGSVIAYNALNRINLKINLDPELSPLAEKIRGLITFGSPLDKIAFFFREQVSKQEYLRGQIIDHIHSFKAKNWYAENSADILKSEIKQFLDDIHWINFWDPKDPISGELDFYKVDQNLALDMKGKWGTSHTVYWNFSKMYQKIIEQFIK
jgi:hypothetical protein